MIGVARPNILLITTDQQRFDALGVNGNTVLRTPNLDGLAAGGVNFSRAYATTPSCIAARRTILTGQHGATHGLPGYQDGLEFNPKYTLPGLLGRAGYQTQLIGKLHMHPQRRRYGFDNLILSETIDYRPDSPWFSRNDYADWLKSRAGHDVDPVSAGVGPNSRVARPFHLDEDLHQTSWLAEEAVRFLTERRDPSCPWFLHLSFWAPHPPLIPPRDYFERYLRAPDWSPHFGSWVPEFPAIPPGIAPDSNCGPFSAAEMREAMAGYYGLVNHVDDRIGRLFFRLFQRGGAREKEPVWVIFTSDHGELLGDHHLFRKTLPYEGSAHIPFFISGRNVPVRPARSDALVCLEDVFPTILDLAGVPIPREAEGKSLVPVVRGGKKQVRDAVFGEHSGGQANHYVVKGALKYCWFARTNEEQLFDLGSDPYELSDISANSSLLNPMRALLARRLKGRRDYSYNVRKLKPLRNAPPSLPWRR